MARSYVRSTLVTFVALPFAPFVAFLLLLVWHLLLLAWHLLLVAMHLVTTERVLRKKAMTVEDASTEP